MSDADAPRPAMRQLLWIAAGVAVLTLLVVALSWLFSPRPSPGDAMEERGASKLKEEQVQKETFVPEAPSNGSARMTEGQAQEPLERIPEKTESPVPQAPSMEDLPAAAPPPPAGMPKPESKASAPSIAASAHSEPRPSKGFAVQVGAFSEEAKAREVAGRLKGLGYTPSVLAKDGKYKVLAKGFSDRTAAEKAQAALTKAGIRAPFIVTVE